MKTTMFIAPFDAMWREIGCLYRALEAQRADLEQSVAGLDAKQIHGRPIAKAPTIASLLLAFGAEESAWLHERWRPATPPPAWKPFLDRTGAPAPDAIVSWLRDVREATRLKLMKANDADLDRQAIAAPDGAAALRWVLHRLLDECAFTRGQIAALRSAS